MPDAHKGQKRASDALELVLQLVVSLNDVLRLVQRRAKLQSDTSQAPDGAVQLLGLSLSPEKPPNDLAD